jgi:hypothetical protein
MRWKPSLAAPAVAIFLIGMGLSIGRCSAGPAWPVEGQRFRVPVTVNAGIYPHTDALARLKLDPEAMRQKCGTTGRISTDSFRLFAVREDGVQTEEPYQILSPGNGGVELVWQVKDALAPLDARTYLLYFDMEGAKPWPRPSYVQKIPGADATLENPVRNPGIEKPAPNDPKLPAFWSGNGPEGADGKIELASGPDVAHSGQRSVKVTCARGRCYGCFQDRIPLKPNALYRVSAQARPDPANTTPGLIVLMTAWLYRADGKHVTRPNAKFQIGTPLFPGQWTEVTTRGLAYAGTDVPTPPDTAFCSLEVAITVSSRKKEDEAVGSIYVDDVEMVELTPKDKTPPVAVEMGEVEQRH